MFVKSLSQEIIKRNPTMAHQGHVDLMRVVD
jgi:hypothetical protein